MRWQTFSELALLGQEGCGGFCVREDIERDKILGLIRIMVGGGKNIYTLVRKIVKHLRGNLRYDGINKEGLKGWNGKEYSYLVLKT